ncbi:MAG: leucyl aminopeptidase [Clostridia bacterium]|nr:leucyl aminopeptidase [Clostridia bacterium]
METRVWHGSLSEVPADTWVAAVTADGRFDTGAAQADAALDGVVTRLRADGDLRGARQQVVVAGPLPRERPRRLVLVGLGDAKDLEPEVVRQAAAVAARAARERGARRVAFGLLGEGILQEPRGELARLVAEGVELGLYRFRGQRQHDGQEPELEECLVVAGREPGAADEVRDGVERGRVLAAATNRARDLANLPGNLLPPRSLAAAAGEVAAAAGLEFEVWDVPKLEAEGCAAILAVGAGSAEPPCLIRLRYRCGLPGRPLLALVGKGVCFDAGGISIKPAEGMETMRMDKAGAAAVIGAMQAIAALRPPVDVLALCPAVQNLPDGRALKPGDVVRTAAGRTIEIVNTDAEGRLILFDACAMAVREGARWVVDVATLTGAAVIALGHQAAAVLGNDDALVEAVVRAGRAAGERYWRLPTYPEYREQYRSEVADLKNTGGRPAGTITGGLIIGEAVGDTPWAHLDIAGTAWEYERPYNPVPKLASGFATRTLVHLVEVLAGDGGAAGGGAST